MVRTYPTDRFMKHEIPGQSKVIPGSLDRPLKLVKSLDVQGIPGTVGNYVCAVCNGLLACVQHSP